MLIEDEIPDGPIISYKEVSDIKWLGSNNCYSIIDNKELLDNINILVSSC